MVYSCISCGAVQPPPFYTSTGSVGVSARYVGSSSGQLNQFSLFFAGELRNVTESNLTFPINVGYGSLSPLLSDSLLPRTNQTWLISPPFVGSQSRQITASLTNYTFPSQCGVARLNIYDNFSTYARRLFTGCKLSDFSDRWVVSTTGRMMVALTTLAESTTDFTLDFSSDTLVYNCGSFDEPNLLLDSTFVVTDGSPSTSDMKRGEVCHWTIGPTYPTPGTITMTFDYLSIKSGGTLQVSDSSGIVLYQCDGSCTVVPPPLTTSSFAMKMVFTSDSSISLGYKGFFGRYMTNYAGGRGLGNGMSYLYMTSAYKLQLPGNGTTYVGNLNYTWVIRPSTTGTIVFAIEDITISRCEDAFSIYDGIQNKLIYSASCGTTVSPRWILSSTNEVVATFRSSQASSLQNGYVLWSYTSDGPNYHCGFSLNPLTLSFDSWIISDGSPSTHVVYSNQRCEWIINPRNLESIILVFERFDLFGGVLNIYNGSISGSLLYSVGGTDIVPVPLSFENFSLYILYASGSIVSGLGFQLKYFTHEGPGDGKLTLSSSSSTYVIPYTRTLNVPMLIVIDNPAALSPIYIMVSAVSLLSSYCESFIEFFDGPPVRWRRRGGSRR